MSSAPASALLSIVAAPALPAETAAPATPLDPTQVSAFSRMLEAEASLAQAVATVPAALVPAEAAAPESAPQLATEPNTDAANDIALALSQAAQAGLSIPVIEEAPDFTEVPTTDLEANVEVEIPSETSEEPITPHSSTTLGDVGTQSSSPTLKSKPIAKASVEGARSTTFDTETELTPETSTTRDAEVSPQLKTIPARLSAKAALPLETESTETDESFFVEGQSTDVQTLESTPSKTVVSTQKTDESDMSSVATSNAALQQQQAQAFNNAQRASVAPVRTQATQNIEATPNRASRVADHKGNDVESAANETETSTDTSPVPIEMFLGAAGVLQASAPRQISSETVEADDSTETQLSTEESVDADFSFTSSVSTRFTRTVSSSNDDTAPQSDFAADVDDVAVNIPAANQQVASDAEVEQAPAFVADLGEVRVIASQNTSRKDVQSVAEDSKQKEIEIQPLRTELRAAAPDKKSVAQVPANDRSAEFSPAFAKGEKIARQSSPEGFSFEAAQKEISASTVTAPFVDGGRPETIASKNSAEPTPTANSSRAERLLDHTLDAIPNPLRITTFEIKPEGHGTIRVRISARGEGENAVWRVQIQTSDPAARSLLSEHLNELRERLPAENVQVELRGANDVRTEVTQRENGGSRERNGEQRQSRGEDQQRQPKQQKSGTFLEWLAAQE